MPVTFMPGALKKLSKHARPAVPPPLPLDQPWRVRVKHMQAIYSVSHTTLYDRIKKGLIPPADGYDLPNRPKGKQGQRYWESATINAHVKKTP